MELKVALPNPYKLEPKMFFAQMRVALKAAEKTYEEAVKNLTEEDRKNVCLNFVHPRLENVLNAHNDDSGESQEIVLRISY